MQLNRPLKPDTTVIRPSFFRRAAHSPLLVTAALRTLRTNGAYEYVFREASHFLNSYPAAETNRKCPRWAEFNSGAPPVPTTPSATSPPPVTPNTSSFSGFNKPSQNVSFGFNAAVPSPLATSPPVSAMEDVEPSMTPSSAAPKLKLTLKRT